VHADGLSGVACIQRGGVTVAEHAGGMADRDLGLACTPETRFQIASVSKHFTAAAVLLLTSQSRLSLDDPVTRWFGGCPQDWRAITLHHLLTHTFDLATIGIEAGDIWCTGADMLRWDEAVARDELLPARLREAMLTPHALTRATAKPKGWSIAGYGYGWQIGTLDGRRAYFHTGDNSGYRALNAWLPDEHIRLAVLANDEAADVLRIAADLLELAT
jgi:CubicO group peptidase (beta-lactamase class C family)